MKPEGRLQRSREPATGSWAERDDGNPHTTSLFL